MGGDYTRFTHDPAKRYSGVLMQQGRVQLDSDEIEWTEILTRRWQLQAQDTFGRCAVPKATTPDGFKIAVVDEPTPDLAIGAGRMYVDGLLAEILAGESFWYMNQRFYPSPLPLAEVAGPNAIVYLDVWEREVTTIEDPDLLEKALGGPDTTTRIQTVWQVKVHGMGQNRVTCDTDLVALFPPSGGRLSSRAIAPPASDDPCILSPTGGYRGLENRLYRVEIHAGGDLKSAKFKWSRENASVVSAVEEIATSGAQSTLTVSRIGRDKVLRFQVDDWVEVLDDYRELMGEAGEMARVVDINEASRTITLDRAISTTAEATRHTRVRRWDQQLNVDADGLLPVSAAWVPLEDGVECRFVLPAGSFHVGDYWVFAARTADGSVEKLLEAPPRGIIHHYCQLAALTGLAPGSVPAVEDCRPLCDPCGGDKGHEDGIHIIDVRPLPPTASSLRNDTEVPVDALARGLHLVCDADVDLGTILQKPTCFVTLDMPFPFTSVDRQMWGDPVIGFQPLILAANVQADHNVISWNPAPATRNWLLDRLFQMMSEFQRGNSVLAHLTLKGNFIWSQDNSALYLDGEAFGVRQPGANNTDITLPSGNGRRGGDFEMWFWLVPTGPSAPAINVQPTALDFGAVNVGSSTDQTLMVSNAGQGTLNVTGMATNNPLFSVVSPIGSFTVAADSQQTVPVRFRPTSAGPQAGVLTINSNDPNHATVTVQLRGEGVAASPTIEVAPATLDFGGVTVGQSRHRTLRVRNTSNAPLTVNSITSDNPRFRVVSPTGSFTVAADSQQTVPVRFRPTSAGPQAGVLTINSNDPDQATVTVQLRGRATQG
jgi:hypothetical protein